MLDNAITFLLMRMMSSAYARHKSIQFLLNSTRASGWLVNLYKSGLVTHNKFLMKTCDPKEQNMFQSHVPFKVLVPLKGLVLTKPF